MNKSTLYGLGAAASWGLSNVLAKALLAHYEPMSFLLTEFVGSSIILWLCLLIRGERLTFSSQIVKYSLLGLIQPGLAFIFGAYGLSLTTANSDSLVWSIETIVIILFSWLVYREKISANVVLLAILGTVGTVLATAPNTNIGQTPSMVLGNLLILAAVICAAAYTVGTQQQLIKIEPWYLMTLHQTASLLMIAILWLICLPFLGPFSKGTNCIHILMALLCGIAQFALPFWLYLKAIKGLGAARTSIFLVLPPVFTITASFLFLGERLDCVQWVGAFLAILAVIGICLLRPDETPNIT